MSNQMMEAYFGIREKILTGAFRPSETLTEQLLADDFHVSRNTIKKALLKLASENLVDIENNKSARVKSFSLSEILQRIQVRELLERFVIRDAALKITDEQLKNLKSILVDMEISLFKKINLVNYSQLNKQFHSIIYAATENQFAVEEIISIKIQLSRYSFKTIMLPGRDYHESIGQHKAIFESLKNHDPDIAEKSISIHITSIMKILSDNSNILL